MVWDYDEGVFDSEDDFLGGSDLDLTGVKHNKLFECELELHGCKVGQNMKKKMFQNRKSARLSIVIRVMRRPQDHPVPQGPLAGVHPVHSNVQQPLRRRIVEIQCKIVGAKIDTFLHNPQCVVRMLFMNGKVREMFRTTILENCENPTWNQSFRVGFIVDEEPQILVLELYNTDEGFQGNHVGTSVVFLQDATLDGRKEPKPLTVQLVGGGDFYTKQMRLKESKLSKARRSNIGADGGDVLSMRHNFQKTRTLSGRLDQMRRSSTELLSQVAATATKAVKQITGAAATGVLYVDVGTRSVKEVVPHAELLLPSTPEAWRPVAKNKKALKPLEKPPRAKEKIAFISGVIYSASNLINADAFGKSDPFCVVAAQLRAGGSTLVYKTRTIDNNLFPVWNEWFHWIIDDDSPDIDKITFSVYDEDQGALADGDDDFLGRATVDINSLPSGVCLKEEIPMTGIKKNQAESTGPKKKEKFRYGPTMIVEVRVERRMFAVPPPSEEERVEMIMKTAVETVDRHALCKGKPLSSKGVDGYPILYVDPGSEPIFQEIHKRKPLAGSRVSSMMQTLLPRTNALSEKAMEAPPGLGRWCRKSPLGPGGPISPLRNDVMRSSFSLPELSQTREQSQSALNNREQMSISMLKRPQVQKEHDAYQEQTRQQNQRWEAQNEQDLQRSKTPVFFLQRPKLRMFQRY